jgi:hypothetical protein
MHAGSSVALPFLPTLPPVPFVPWALWTPDTPLIERFCPAVTGTGLFAGTVTVPLHLELHTGSGIGGHSCLKGGERAGRDSRRCVGRRCQGGEPARVRPGACP